MFNVLVGRKKSRLSSPRMIAVSVGAHLLLFGGVAVASSVEKPKDEEPLVDVTYQEIPKADEPRKPETPQPEERKPEPKPDEPAPKLGKTLELPAPTDVPKDLPPVNVDDRPVNPNDYRGDGTVGDSVVAGPLPPKQPKEPTGGHGTTVEPTIYDMSMVEEKPGLTNAPELRRLLERNYPVLLRDAGVTGRVELRMVVGPDGRVEPGTVEVISATHEGFSAASVRVAERMRFRPARIGGQAVRLLVTLPIDWQLSQ